MRSKLIPGVLNQAQSDIRAVTRAIEAVGGINLGQGTCALPPHPEIVVAAGRAVEEGHNSYTFYDGIPYLKDAIIERVAAYNSLHVARENILVTSGATGAFECICKCFIEAGDEIVVFEPIYKYHLRQAMGRGAIVRHVSLHAPDWSFDLEELASVFTARTKFLVFSNPNNPTGKVFSREELLLIGELCRHHNVIAVVDEVYEYILSDGAQHISLASLPGMFEHTITISSASKTFFVTGWRVGWAIGPQDVIGLLGVKSDETYVCAPAPLQHAVAHGLRLPQEFFGNIKVPFQDRKSALMKSLAQVGFTPHPPEGAYYVLADYPSAFADDDITAMQCLVEQIGVGAVPGREFFPSRSNTGMLRFCYAITDEKLEEACQRLARLPQI